MKKKVEQPKFLPGQKVLVKNYRRKDFIESGKVIKAEYHLHENGGHWYYHILLDRISKETVYYGHTKGGNRIWLNVSNEALESI